MIGSRHRFVYYVLIAGIDSIITAPLKQFYHAPRPFMVNPMIKTMHCSKEFGNPSGHSTAAYFLIAHFLDKFHGKESKYVGKRIQSLALYYLSLFLLCIYLVAIPYSRLLDGVHSIDQVLIGI